MFIAQDLFMGTLILNITSNGFINQNWGCYELFYVKMPKFQQAVSVYARIVNGFSYLYCLTPQGSWSEHVCCLHLKMEFRSCARGASVVWHHSLLLMNGFNKTEAAVFSCRLCFFHFHRFDNSKVMNVRPQK